MMICKFDENKGFIPAFIYPPKLSSKENSQLLKDIAKNAIGFGSNIQFNQFEMSSVHVLSRRFTRKESSARGGVEIYSLAILSKDTINLDRSLLEDYTNKILENWDNHPTLIKEMYNHIFKNLFSTPDQETISYQEHSQSSRLDNLNNSKKRSRKKTQKQEIRKSFLFEERLLKPERNSFFAPGFNIYRNVSMTIGMLLIILILAFKYNFVSFIVMFDFGILLFSFINNRKRVMRISVGLISIFILYMIIGVILLIFYNFPLLVQPSFPNVLVQPQWAILSLLSGFLICIGLDRGKNIDKFSTIIGIIFIIIDILLFIVVPTLLSM
ncbi:MAG: hypothetical protein ACTSUG_17910 [Candidatus Helarchaeota archaeon]